MSRCELYSYRPALLHANQRCSAFIFQGITGPSGPIGPPGPPGLPVRDKSLNSLGATQSFWSHLGAPRYTQPSPSGLILYEDADGNGFAQLSPLKTLERVTGVLGGDA